uniref:RRM domain-containing protein n=1 Tax=Eutreptiella gymnastica TaxID=73025 RepID=A0A7S1J7V9_9EUGL
MPHPGLHYAPMMPPDSFMSQAAAQFPRPPQPKGMYPPQMHDPMAAYMNNTMPRGYGYAADQFQAPRMGGNNANYVSSGPKTRRVNDLATDMIWKAPNIHTRVDNNKPPKSRCFFSLESHIPASNLAEVFRNHGEVESVYYIKTRRLCGYVKFANAEAATNAVETLNGTTIRNGVAISMSIAEPQKVGVNS